MLDHPLLAPKVNAPLLRDFLRASNIDPKQPPLELLTAVATAFARLPFENLTKILKKARASRIEEARRFPSEVLGDHWALGTGGTCFALTATLLYLVRALGWQAEPILADRRYGPDTHSALLVWLDGGPHLLDPGYLILRPLPIPTKDDLTIATPFNQLILKPREAGGKVELHTVSREQAAYRLTYKARPVDAGEFLHAWDISFDQDMLRYPVLSRVSGGRQIYLQKNNLLIRGQDATQRAEVSAEQVSREISRTFGIDARIVAEALAHLQRKGERHGSAVGA